MRRLVFLAVVLLLSRPAWAAKGALPATTVWDINGSATANTVNGGGFNPSNTNGLTDLAGASANTADPDVSSASYTFVAGDVGAWVYISAGTGWTPGYYQIDCVGTGCDPDLTAGHARLKADVGEANIVDANAIWGTNASAGCATTASPTGGTFLIDYSRLTTAIVAADANLATDDGIPASGGCVVTSSGHTFTANEVGNYIHVTAGTNWTPGWYEIASVSGGAATLTTGDCGTDGALSGGTWYLGGALTLSSSSTSSGIGPDGFFEMVTGGNVVWIAGTNTLGSAVATASTSCDSTNACWIWGYNTRRGDMPTGNARPLITSPASQWQAAQYTNVGYLRLTLVATGAYAFRVGTGGFIQHSQVRNLRTATTNGVALSLYGAGSLGFDIDVMSIAGIALEAGSGQTAVIGAYIHDSLTGFSVGSSSSGLTMMHSVIARNRTGGLSVSAAYQRYVGNTIYGTAAQRGTGVAFGTYFAARFFNNIFSGFTTGMTSSGTYRSTWGDYNNYYNNGADTDGTIFKGAHDFALDPQFVDATEIVVSDATSANNSILTCSGCDFTSVVNDRDVFHLTTTGVNGVAGGYLITDHTQTTLTLSADCDSGGTGSGLGGYIGVGHNFAVGPNMKARGFPGSIGPGTETFLDTGAVQRQEQDTPTPAPTPTMWPATPTAIPTCG